MIEVTQKNILLIVIDACSFHAVRRTEMSHLRELIGTNEIVPLRPDPGFLERLPIFTGLSPKEHKIQSAFEIKKNQSSLKYSLLHQIDAAFKFLGQQANFRKLTWKIRKYLNIEFFPAAIPFNIIPNLYLTEDGPLGLITLNIDMIIR